MLALTQVTQRYGAFTALDAIDLTVPRGEFFALLGPNGAGKSTLMSLVAGLRAPDSGQLTWAGDPLGPAHPDLRRRLGLVPQNLALYEDLTAEENLRIFGTLYGLDRRTLTARVDAALRSVHLHDRRHHRVKTFSGGMQRRLNLVAALLHEPELLLCDEPTVGVDPQSRHAIFEFLRARHAAGLTIIYSTHYMEEATRLCSRIGIIDHGRLLACGPLDELLTALPAGEQLRLARTPATDAARARLAPFGRLTTTPDHHTLALHPTTRLSTVFAALESASVPSTACTLARPSLEDAFLHLTGQTLRD